MLKEETEAGAGIPSGLSLLYHCVTFLDTNHTEEYKAHVGLTDMFWMTLLLAEIVF